MNPQVNDTFDPHDLNRDSDGDGLSDWYEKHISHTDPNNPDTIGDGLTDGFRVKYGLINPDGTITGHPEWAATADADGDGLSNYDEMTLGTNPIDQGNMSVKLFNMTPITGAPITNCPAGQACTAVPQAFACTNDVAVMFPPGSHAYLVQAQNGTNILIDESIVMIAGAQTSGYIVGYQNARDDVRKYIGKDPAGIYCFVPPIDVTSFINSLPIADPPIGTNGLPIGPAGLRHFSANLIVTPKVEYPPCPPTCPPCMHCYNGACINDTPRPCMHPGPDGWVSDCPPYTHCEGGTCVNDTPPPCTHLGPNGWVSDCSSNEVCSNGVCIAGGGDGGDGGGGFYGWGGGGYPGGFGHGGGGPLVDLPGRDGITIWPPYQPTESGGCVSNPVEVYASSPVWLVVVTNATASVQIRIDSNNDRQLTSDDDAVKTNQAFRFWVNNDSDEPTEANPNGEDFPYGNDSYDNKIDCVRDLEDFAQMEIDVDEATLELITNHNYKVALVSTGPQVNVFPAYQAGSAYLTDMNVATNQARGGAVRCNDYLHCGMGCCFVLTDPAPPCSIAQDLNNLTITNLQNYFLFEGKTAGTGVLRVEVRNPVGGVVTNDTAKIQIQDIKDLYERVESYVNSSVPNPDVGGYTFVNTVGQPFPSDGGFATTNVILFVHGSNDTAFDKQYQEQTMVKRLYWEGFNGRFISFHWPTLVGLFGGLIPAPYNHGEYVSFKCAAPLAAYLQSGHLAGYNVSMCAHSMGNMVASEAILLAGAGHVTHFTLMQAAVTAHCYDPDPLGLLDDDYLTTVTTPAPDTYRSRFAAIDTLMGGNKAVNFYNPVDGVLPWWIVNEHKYKPDTYYDYFPSTDEAKHFQFFPPDLKVYDRTVNDIYERLAFVARPRANTAGVQGATGGSVDISKGKNLNALLGLVDTRPDHSGQFTRDMINVRRFYDLLLDSFNIPHKQL